MMRTGLLRMLASLLLASAFPAAAQPPAVAAPAAATPAFEALEPGLLASRFETPGWRDWPARPQWPADPLQAWVAIDATGQVSLVDGEHLEPFGAIEGRRRWRGTPHFTPDGRYAFLASSDGWVGKLDLWNLRVAVELRVGSAAPELALSSDGLWLLVVRAEPPAALLLDAALQPVRSHPARTRAGQPAAAIASVLDVAPRRSFVLALQDQPELWEISYDPAAPPIYDGLVHDYQMGEAIARPGFLGVRRTPLDEPLAELAVGPNPAYLLASTRPHADGSARAVVLNLDVRRVITTVPMAGAPRPAGAAALDWQGTPVLALPNATAPALSVIDTRSWKLLAPIAMRAPVLALQSHRASPYLWASLAPGTPDPGALALVDRRSLAALPARPGTLQSARGPVEFSHDGRVALVHSAADDKLLLALDTTTLKELARLALPRPATLYSIGNRIAAHRHAPAR